MLDTYKPNTEAIQGHLRAYKDFQEIMELHHSLSDRMPRKFDFEADFKVVIPERDARDNIPADQDALVFYTDGSRKEGRKNMNLWTLSEAL
jgi:hypothetical protein